MTAINQLFILYTQYVYNTLESITIYHIIYIYVNYSSAFKPFLGNLPYPSSASSWESFMDVKCYITCEIGIYKDVKSTFIFGKWQYPVSSLVLDYTHISSINNMFIVYIAYVTKQPKALEHFAKIYRGLSVHKSTLCVYMHFVHLIAFCEIKRRKLRAGS